MDEIQDALKQKLYRKSGYNHLMVQEMQAVLTKVDTSFVGDE